MRKTFCDMCGDMIEDVQVQLKLTRTSLIKGVSEIKGKVELLIDTEDLCSTCGKKVFDLFMKEGKEK